MMSFLNAMNTVSLAELDTVALLNRIDNKYVLNLQQLKHVLPVVEQHYKVLEIESNKIFTYENNYFDTKDLQFYYDHHNGYANRMKVRSRKYVETDTSFFEIKKKENIDRTSKTREKIDQLISIIDENKKEAVQQLSRKPIADLSVILNNKFNRITFVNKELSERMTLDFNIHFSDEFNQKQFSDLYVLEIKQSKSNGRSIITELLKKNNIREQSFSKYIFGVIALKENIRMNNFLPLIKKINKL
jgi:VTC domain